MNLFHRLYDKLYPLFRFTYERLMGHAWFSQVTPHLWLGGAPSCPRDYDFLVQNGISASLNVRAERSDDTGFFERHDIAYLRLEVPDIAVPDPGSISRGVDWIDEQLQAGRTVLVHCAKGRGRSATLLAAYLMDKQGMSFEQAEELLRSKRALTKLEPRHRRVLVRWLENRTTRS
jgi:atypical dual specificity phosphatase